ncbi:type IV pilus modification protein PilV [Neptunomonas antarctica]|nr:type IV pilus modification protein PilV [Neptunomonas antarctica]
MKFQRYLPYQHGVGLIEVLITLLVLSVGLLGMATLQIRAVQLNQSSYLRSQAITLAYDMADRISINGEASASYAQAIAADIPANPLACAGADSVSYSCSGTPLATSDLSVWLTSLAVLPAGDGSIAISGDGEQVIITVCWDDNRGAGTDGSAAICGIDGLTFFQFSMNI